MSRKAFVTIVTKLAFQCWNFKAICLSTSFESSISGPFSCFFLHQKVTSQYSKVRALTEAVLLIQFEVDRFKDEHEFRLRLYFLAILLDVGSDFQIMSYLNAESWQIALQHSEKKSNLKFMLLLESWRKKNINLKRKWNVLKAHHLKTECPWQTINQKYNKWVVAPRI